MPLNRRSSKSNKKNRSRAVRNSSKSNRAKVARPAKNSSKSNKRNSTRKVRKGLRRTQRGGVGFTFDHNCRVGGLPARVATSECPNIGPLDSCSIKAAYGQSCNRQIGGKRKLKSSKKSKKARK